MKPGPVAVWLRLAAQTAACILLVCAVPAFSGPLASARGINLNGLLDSARFPDSSTHRQDLEGIRAAGFNAVRVPLKVLPRLDPSGRVEPRFLTRLQELASDAQSLGMIVVLDIHDGQFISMEPEAAGIQLSEAWAQIAEALRGVYPGVHFELLNEPRKKLTPSAWMAVQRRVAAAVHEVDPGRGLVLAGSEYSTVSALSPVSAVPGASAGTAHYYLPMRFTHQGATWLKDAPDWLGTEWTGTGPEMYEVRLAADRLVQWRTRTGADVFVGEFGVHKSAPQFSASNWIRTFRTEMEAVNSGWFYWSYKGDFGLFDVNRKCWRVTLLALLPQSEAPICANDSARR